MDHGKVAMRMKMINRIERMTRLKTTNKVVSMTRRRTTRRSRTNPQARYRAALVLALSLFLLAGCGTTSNVATDLPTEAATLAPTDSTEQTPEELPVFTAETLAKYDGKDGNPAYVAINGTVYDVSAVPNWKGGLHNRNTAGMDLTPALGKSPHGEKVLADLPIVGTFE